VSIAGTLGAVTGTHAWIAAHQGGWDELLFVLLPIGLFGGLLAIANRRATRLEAERDADPDDDE
jgi:hypothetical protein